MKKLAVAMCAGVLVCNSVAQTYDDLDLSGIPNEFVNGTNADADQVNANFQYLQNNLATLVSILEQQKTIQPPANRFSGNYTVSGIEVLLSAGSCALPNQNGAVHVSNVSGTATSDGASLSLNTSDPTARLFIGNPTTVDSTTVNIPDVVPISASGAIDTFGQFSADGGTFSASAYDDESSGGCTVLIITHITGVRIP